METLSRYRRRVRLGDRRDFMPASAALARPAARGCTCRTRSRRCRSTAVGSAIFSSTNGCADIGASSGTGSAHPSASSSAPVVLPTSHSAPTSKWSSRIPSISETDGRCTIRRRITAVGRRSLTESNAGATLMSATNPNWQAENELWRCALSACGDSSPVSTRALDLTGARFSTLAKSRRDLRG